MRRRRHSFSRPRRYPFTRWLVAIAATSVFIIATLERINP